MVAKDLYGGIEAGGTKFVCMVGNGPAGIAAQLRIQTTSPQETLSRVNRFFDPFVRSGQIRTLGIGAFGPIDLDPTSPDYGCMGATPKLAWQNTNIPAGLQTSHDLTVELDTDVNAAALGEATWGAGHGVDPLLYVTIGTGIGGGFIQVGRPLHGQFHPEMGHIRIPHSRDADGFRGSCPFHGDCFEGLASGPAIEQRLGRRAETLSDDDPFWEVEAGYIAGALTSYILILSPSRIILGGGIMQRQFMFPTIRGMVLDSLNGYVQTAALLEHMEDYIVPPELGDNSGVLGALALAQQAEARQSPKRSSP